MLTFPSRRRPWRSSRDRLRRPRSPLSGTRTPACFRLRPISVRIGSNRNVSIGTTTYTAARLQITSAGQPLRCDYSGDTGSIFYGLAGSPTYAGNGFTIDVVRAATNAYSFLYARSSVGGLNDVKFNLSGNGSGYCDGAWTGGGADYAEFFEWADGNPEAADRRGLSVVLEGAKIRAAAPGDSPEHIVGIVSATPCMIGDGAWNVWAGKYLRDAYGGYLLEDVEFVAWTEDGTPHVHRVDALPAGIAVPPDATYTVERRRVVNPDYDPMRSYVPRERRPEWSVVGLVGKLSLRRGRPTGDRWIRLRDCGPDVEEWLVR
ncbi:hypothetical protein JZU48_02045 [bacterium]|nr:hypothetical protein [bacterium]